MNAQSGLLSALVVATLAACANGRHSLAAETVAQGLTDEQRAIAELAVQTLAADLKIPPGEIRVDTVRDVDWRDSSLGCPRPGMAYLDVVTPGHQVTLEAGGQTYVVHEAANRAFVCRQPRLADGPAAAGNKLQFAPQLLAARKDLAARLQVPESEIQVSGAAPMTWGDASLGCPEPGVQYAQVLTEGWVLRLRHGKRDFTYHADASRTIPCPGIAAE